MEPMIPARDYCSQRLGLNYEFYTFITERTSTCTNSSFMQQTNWSWQWAEEDLFICSVRLISNKHTTTIAQAWEYFITCLKLKPLHVLLICQSLHQNQWEFLREFVRRCNRVCFLFLTHDFNCKLELLFGKSQCFPREIHLFHIPSTWNINLFPANY